MPDSIYNANTSKINIIIYIYTVRDDIKRGQV